MAREMGALQRRSYMHCYAKQPRRCCYSLLLTCFLPARTRSNFQATVCRNTFIVGSSVVLTRHARDEQRGTLLIERHSRHQAVLLTVL